MGTSMHQGEYRDLNKNGRLDPYEDPTYPIEERVNDLLGQMTLEEKAGLMFHAIAFISPPPGSPDSTEFITTRHMTHFNLVGNADARTMAGWANRLQEQAEQTRLGIPVTLATDPRHAFTNNPGAAFAAGSFSQWPETLGLAAVGDAALVEQFGDIARQEYTAVGLRVALHPMADLATEPRWARNNGTFGEEAELASRMVAAYIRGFQGRSLSPTSVACMTKHFPGGGPQKDGEDAHFAYGKEQVYPGHNFEYHLIPFESALATGTAQIMPYYGVPVGLEYEEVGFGFSHQVITGLLRERYGFEGVVCTDWGLLSESLIFGRTLEARAWGVEHLDLAGRMLKAIEAGVDQFGGESCPEVLVELVRSGRVSEERLDISVRRLLRDKFRLGLFDNPYVSLDEAEQIVGNSTFKAAAEAAQRRAFTLLKNDHDGEKALLPLAGRPRLYLEEIDPQVAAGYAEVVSSPTEAEVALIRLRTPFDPRDTLPLESFFHAGRLDFTAEEIARVQALCATVPTIVVLYLDRPAVLPEIATASAALLAEYGASDAAVLDVVFGKVRPEGKLPFELPSSMQAVVEQKSDLPYDSENPVFPFGFGLSY